MAGLDKLFAGMRSTSTGLSAERVRMDVIAENIANARTTKTAQGGPYRRQLVKFEPLVQKAANGQMLTVGLKRAEVVQDFATPFEKIFDESHPHKDENNMVAMPNVSATREMADLVSAMRAYEANLAAQENFTRMAERALQMAR
ncbi:MAG: flagellar basal-body rod protein FlgC [Bacteroidia bacterium]|jgi:flagellar basal-body rod protein FlgC